MDSIAARMKESGHHIRKEGDAFVLRARSAGAAFLGETREAGVELVGAVRTEARRWQRFATQRTIQLRRSARSAMSVPAFEKAVLGEVDQVLRTIEARIRARLAHLDRGRTRAARKPASKAAARSRKSKPALPPLAA